MCAPKAPEPPDPKETSAAATGTNVATAIANTMLGNVNQVTPDGSLTYGQTGSYDWTDPFTGKKYTLPTFTATQALSDAQQQIKDQSDATSLNLAATANEQSAFLKDYLGEPVNLNIEATEARLYELGAKRLDPRFERERDALETRLSNQGIVKGSEAYDREMERFAQSKTDAYNQLALQGRAQATQEALTERNQPINEIIGLISGAQVKQPQFVPTGTAAIPTTNNAELINTNYGQRLAAWQQEMQSRGGLFGDLLGFGAGLLKSDRRLKKDIKKVGSAKGHPLYEYRFKGDGPATPKEIGVMAQDVEKVRPDAVFESRDGVKMVKYGQLFGLGR